MQKKRFQKAVWKKPRLIILTRGKPEEGVLAMCKDVFGISGYGPGGWGCVYGLGCGGTICFNSSPS